MGKHIQIKLREEERNELEKLIKTGEHASRVNTRARILLLIDRSQGKKRSVKEVSEVTHVSPGTVYNVKKRYHGRGLEAALKEGARPGRPVSKMTGEVEAQLIALACSDPPEGYAQWTLRLLADRLEKLQVVETISHTAVANKLKKMNLNLGE